MILQVLNNSELAGLSAEGAGNPGLFLYPKFANHSLKTPHLILMARLLVLQQ